MPKANLAPPLAPASQIVPILRQQGYGVLGPQDVHELTGCAIDALDALQSGWDDLPADAYLKDGGRYRRRRHSCFVLQGDTLALAPHRAHWQPLEYNALHGGMQRLFEPLAADTVARPVWTQLLVALGHVLSQAQDGIAPGAQDPRPWYIEAHQFRIDTTDGIGRPTPEGAHRDGVDYVAVLLAGRAGIKGGESRVFEADGPNGQRFTMTEPWTLLLVDDARVVHESTPIQPLDAAGHRDTLVLTYRRAGFQGDA